MVLSGRHGPPRAGCVPGPDLGCAWLKGTTLAGFVTAGGAEGGGGVDSCANSAVIPHVPGCPSLRVPTASGCMWPWPISWGLLGLVKSSVYLELGSPGEVGLPEFKPMSVCATFNDLQNAECGGHQAWGVEPC